MTAPKLSYLYDDGGRAAAGFKGLAGDCVARSVAIASGRPYAAVYAALARGMGAQRKSKGASARNGVSIGRKWFRDYMRAAGFTWVATMTIGSGCRVHLADGELPAGRLVVRVSKHCTAIVDGVIRDTHDPRRDAHVIERADRPLRPGEWRNVNGICRIERRCVYGYWKLEG